MFVLVRKYFDADTVMGELYLNGYFICYTLENAKKAIPCGYYDVTNSMSPKFKRKLPLVSGRKCAASRGIRIHKGNTWKDSAGCVLVGMGVNYPQHKITNSAEAEAMVVGLVESVHSLVITEV